MKFEALLLIILIGGCIGMTEQTDGQNRIAVVDTSQGTFKFELYEQRAPISTANFIKLVESDFYTGLTFHRYEPGFVIQGGDPKGDGTGGSDETISLEIHPELRHVKGALGMARSQDPNSASSQFYVCLDDANFLDDNYAVFGITTEGIENVLKLRPGDKINSITIE
ncbi:peptidylprolyl isomerase [Candidatus Undinarchaeota archaeon]